MFNVKRGFVIGLFLAIALISFTSAYEPTTRSHPEASGFGQDHISWAQHRSDARVVFVSNQSELDAALKSPRPMWIKPTGGMVLKPTDKFGIGRYGGKRILGLAPGGFIMLGSIYEGEKPKRVISIENMAVYNYPQLGGNRNAMKDDVIQITTANYTLFRRLSIGGGRDEQLDGFSANHISIKDNLFIMARPSDPDLPEGKGGTSYTHEAHVLVAGKGRYASVIGNSFPNGWDRAPLIQKFTGESILNMVTGNQHGTTSQLRGVSAAEIANWEQRVNIQFTGWESTAAVTIGGDYEPSIAATPLAINDKGYFSGQYNYIDFRPTRNGVFMNRSAARLGISRNLKIDGNKFPNFYDSSRLSLDPIDLSDVEGYVPTELPSQSEIDYAMARQNELPSWLNEVKEYSGPVTVNEVMLWQRQVNRERRLSLRGLPDWYDLPKIDTSRMKPYPQELIKWLTRDGHVIQEDGYALIEHFDFEQEEAMLKVQKEGGSLDEIYAAQDRVIEAWRQKAIEGLKLPAPSAKPIPADLIQQLDENIAKYESLAKEMTLLDIEINSYEKAVKSATLQKDADWIGKRVGATARLANDHRLRLVYMKSNPASATYFETAFLAGEFSSIKQVGEKYKSQFAALKQKNPADYPSPPTDVNLPSGGSSGGSSSKPNVPQDSGEPLKLSLEFNDVAGTQTFLDESTYNKNATCIASFNCPITANGAAVFNGFSSYLDYSTPMPKGSGSIIHWVMPFDSKQGVLVYESDGSGSSYDGFGTGASRLEIHTAILSNGEAFFIFEDGAVESVRGGKLSVGKTSLVVATWNQSGNLSLYVDGELVASKDISSKKFSNKEGKVRKIGVPANGKFDRAFKGYMSSLDITSKELSASEVMELYNSEKDSQLQGGVGSSITGAVIDEEEEGTYTSSLSDSEIDEEIQQEILAVQGSEYVDDLNGEDSVNPESFDDSTQIVNDSSDVDKDDLNDNSVNTDDSSQGFFKSFWKKLASLFTPSK